MDEAFIGWKWHPELWAASTAVVVFAAFVALDLARGGSSRHKFTVARTLSASAFALAAGAWATHFVSMAGEPLPFALGYDSWWVFGALVLSFVCCFLGVGLSALPQLGARRVLAAALVLGSGACAVPALGLKALHLSPAPVWNWGLVAAGWGAATALIAGALSIVAARRRADKPLGLWRQGVVALGLGGGLSVGNAALVLACQVPLLSLSVASGRVGVSTISALAWLGVPVLLCLLMISSLMEARFRVLLHRTRDEVKRAAQTDRLTALPNRSMFEEYLQLVAIRADKQQHRLALLFINIDGLKSINESFGQSTGDRALCEVANRLRQCVGERDMVARSGGDEFIVLLEGDPASEQASRMAERILGNMNALCRVEDHEVTMSCSVGIAMYPSHGTVTKLIAHASAAMREAKRGGGASHRFFEDRMVAGARDQIELLQDLRRAIANKELELHYQPKIHAPSGQITGAEALKRWKHPTRGMVGPFIFIPLAERFGLINALGNWLIEDVCRQIKAWRNDGLRMRVAINLSVHQLRQHDLVERIVDALKRHSVEPSLLTCEITESAAMDDTRVTLQVIEQLSAAGVHLSIDDFGTGYSSLSYLRQLAAEELKIDRSFVLDLETSADARAIVDAVVKLAQALGLKVVAEGVETEQQQEILRTLGCNELQGYLFAKPMPAAALALWAMKDEGPRPLDFRPSLFGDTLPQSIVN
ncbi:MAG TPA: EAL domain-containing protein [Rhizobacter sp.]|nr:EAL domain-containing protein [Rhizobacter sp.]